MAVPAGETRPRARELGVPLDGRPGARNAITDVPGVEVGAVTIVHEGDGGGAGAARTGVTAILPRGRAGLGEPCAAGVSALNGNGELTGSHWIEESGSFRSPILITNSHAVGAVHRGVDRWVHARRPDIAATWMLPVVGETWDGYLNDINADHVTDDDVARALDAASPGDVAEGSVGGGTGMNCYGFKGGTGTASRLVAHGGRDFTVGVLLQANFGSRRELSVRGAPLGRSSAAPCPMEEEDWLGAEVAGLRAVGGAGSVIVVVLTDAPLLPGQAKAIARRVPLGLARTGTTGSHFSGDLFLAASTANAGALTSRMGPAPADAPFERLDFVPWGSIDPFFAAAVEAVEEAVVNALVAADDVVGRDGHRSFALPHDEVRAAFAGRGA